jgi:acyl-CoA thioesterase-2
MSEPERTPVEQLLEVLDLQDSIARTNEDIFTGISHSTPWGRIYGGQVLAQAVVATQRTVPIDRILHSLHGYFLRPGNIDEPITFAVDRIHDGRSFATRRTQAYQNGEPIWSMISSFQDTDPGFEHFIAPPADIPDPESLSNLDEVRAGIDPGMYQMLQARAIEFRHVEPSLWLGPDPSRAASQNVWMRVRGQLPDNPEIHRAALAYMSDMTLQESVLRRNGLTWLTPGLRVASLDHAMFWHRFARVDQWLLYTQESPNARGGRGLATGRIYTQDGMLVATVAQEVMFRTPELA